MLTKWADYQFLAKNMALTHDQPYQACKFYMTALQKTREDYLSLMRTNDVSNENQNKIWHVSLTLNYRKFIHEKYTNLLEFLAKDPNAACIMEAFCSQLTLNPNDDLEAFIMKAYEIINSEGFKSKLKELMDSYFSRAMKYGLGAMIFIFLTIVSLYLLPIIGVWSLALSALSYVEALYMASSGEAEIKKDPQLKELMDSLKESTSINYSHKEEEKYDYKIQNSSVSIVHKHLPTSKAVLKQNFFAFQMDRKKPLNDEVQEQFNSLFHMSQSAE